MPTGAQEVRKVLMMECLGGDFEATCGSCVDVAQTDGVILRCRVVVVGPLRSRKHESGVSADSLLEV